ncbi:glycosyltransferase family 39 protein [Mycolicibacterium litorale]|uniref:glycosyltransferase family 39 protein n=1 Tax=Mycolicibacterium litorale TaxID=758802 RepID=UPI003CF55744
MLVSAAGASRPSFWSDEAATISASTRSLPELWDLTRKIDAVHGLYYLVMHGWFAVFPESEFWSRLPSALAVGVAAAGVVAFGRQLSTRSVALTAGAMFAILPRVTAAGIEARSYAFTMAAAVWLMVVGVAALRRDRRWLWVSYTLCLALATALNVFCILMIGPLAAAALTLASSRRAVTSWAVASAVASVVMTPFVIYTQSQSSQVDWIPTLGARTLGELAVEQYFPHVYAFFFALLTAVVAVLAARRWRHDEGAAARDWPLAVTTVVWIVFPTVALLIYSVVRQPIYQPRYLSFTAPALALLAGLCVVVVGRSRRRIACLVAVFAVAGAYNYAMQRAPFAKERMDYSHVADVVAHYARPGDCLVFDVASTWKVIGPLKAARPAAFSKLQDPGRMFSATELDSLWDAHTTISTWSERLRDCPSLWTISERDATLPTHQRGDELDPGPKLSSTPAYQVARAQGFRLVERWQFSMAQVVKSQP